MTYNDSSKPVSRIKIFGYALGDGALSIAINGVSNFAMLYYTQILGLGAAYAGIALSITLFWDAITDPVMGHITDNTRTRFGRRIPYMVLGGIFLALSFLLLWVLPARFSATTSVFCCVLAINLVLRTALTVFMVPYTALGFEICSEYTDRSKLQGARYFINQMTNLVFGAMAWSLFFQDKANVDGSRIDGTAIAGNYLVMGKVLAAVILVVIGGCVFSVRRYAIDNRSEMVVGNGAKEFVKDFSSILKDRLAWFVFGFLGLALLGMLLTSQAQMFTYVFYMKFSALEKTCVHGAGMLVFALAALSLPVLVKRFDKKHTAYLGMVMSVLGGLALFAVFTGGLLEPQATVSFAGKLIPVATIVFGLFQALWWAGCGILVPLAQSMIADISEINQYKTNVRKDGGYASVLSFFMKAASSAGLMITGYMLTFAGIVSNADSQTLEAARNISVMTFLCGPVIMIFAFLVLRKYPIDQFVMKKMRVDSES